MFSVEMMKKAIAGRKVSESNADAWQVLQQDLDSSLLDMNEMTSETVLTAY